MTLDLDPTIAIPAIASIAVMWTSSVEAAFMRIYIPVLLLLPDAFYFGWPPMNFHQYAILPIGIALIWWAIAGKWRFSLIDVAVFAFIAWGIGSDVHASGSVDIANRILTPVTLALFPYMAGKLLIEQTGKRIALARRFVFLVFIDCLVSAYEFRFGVSPFRKFFGGFFTSVDPWITQLRYGFGRTAGPFGHAIFMGAMVAIALLLYRYLWHFGLLEERFRWLPQMRLNKKWIVLIGLVTGSLMTISRGPWIAVFVGVMVGSVGTAVDRQRAFRRVILTLVAGGALIYLGGKAYLAGAGKYEEQEELSSAVYRTELVDEYQQIAMQHEFWGWGTSDWPKVEGMISVDNWYLLLALMYGVTGLVLFIVMLLVPVTRLLWVGMYDPDLSVDQRALLFGMSSIIVTVAVAVITVFLGCQLYPVLFLFLGWSDACLVYRPMRSQAMAPAFAFRRVIA